MRQRADKGQKASDHPSAVAEAAARAASKRSSARQSPLRGFWIGTGCFVFCLVVYMCLKGNSAFSMWSVSSAPKAKAGLRVTERDVVALGLATQEVAEMATLPRFEELSKIKAQIGTVYLTLLEQVNAAEELEDGGHALRQLDVSQHYLTSVGDALRMGADVSYTKLKRMLLREPNAELAMAPTSLVRTTYGWILSDLFLYGAVLPEYYLWKDDTEAHAVVLLRSVNLLSWSSSVSTARRSERADAQLAGGASLTGYDIFNWSDGAACGKGPLGALSPKWMQFCETSFSSTSSAARRAAAVYEELIVLYPNYAPLRLHYAIAFTFLGPHLGAGLNSGDGAATATGEVPFSLSAHSMQALRVIRNDRAKLGTQYKKADTIHAPVLMLLEAYLTPADLWTSEQSTQLVHALGELRRCEHLRASLLTATRWSGGVFQEEYRVPLLNPEQLGSLLATARLHLGADHTVLAPFRECV
ncbi:hypothetical protein ABL78_5910 [Leptomonas seymouri]|uniref:Uncharacterized protein n=1 Tax=Leptomonas seymouri TaxID=5684 RepID=A0A0N0P492_LEPSE|nr:hypothetical protein ABL78_5910 [Leptomonas seymouri]|eukprot:KPI85026.1 hypothetical protein ABL78_5910 [Leptomonas seymouri]